MWNSTVAWGMEYLGDLGMFVFMKALAAHPGDGGEAALEALTKCDQVCHATTLHLAPYRMF